MEDKRYRSILKGITWRFFATVDTFLIAWLITGKVKYAISISSIEVITKLLLYYLHERIWNRVKLGKKTKEIEYYI